MPDAEIWKPVKGFEGLYEVSSLGRVRSVERRVKIKNNNTRTVPAKIRACVKDNNELKVMLCREGKLYNTSVSKVVAEAFLGAKPPGDPHVVHIDGDWQNNAVTNLRYRKTFYLPENPKARELFSEKAKIFVLAFIKTKHKYLNAGIGDTDDFIQEALLQIWQDIDAYDRKIAFSTFCYTRCESTFKKLYKKYIRIKSREISAYETYGDDTNPRYLIDTLACQDNFYERIDDNA